MKGKEPLNGASAASRDGSGERSIADQSGDRVSEVRLLMDYIHRLFLHHSLWFAEVRHQLGWEAAWEILDRAWERAEGIIVKRLSRTLGFPLQEDMPQPLLEMPPEKFRKLKESVAVNWLAVDGVWFQALEFTRGMTCAKRINDSVWAAFSPVEAHAVKRFLGLKEQPGLEGLKIALQYRLYAAVNEQSITDETPTSFIFRMNRCRVQAARRRKGLPDYPCKSGGIAEYTTFAAAIDRRIRTRCVACPPDPHPEEWYCAWEFTLQDETETPESGGK